MSLTFCANRFPEFQLGGAQGIPSRGEIDENNHPPRQSHHSLSPSQLDDGLFLHPAPGNRRDVLDQNLLAELSGSRSPIRGIPLLLWLHNPHCGRENHLQIPYPDGPRQREEWQEEEALVGLLIRDSLSWSRVPSPSWICPTDTLHPHRHYIGNNSLCQLGSSLVSR